MIDTALLTTVIWITFIGIGLAFAIGIAIIADQALRHRESRQDAARTTAGPGADGRAVPADATQPIDAASAERDAAQKQAA
ncbi:hypothetical protein [Nocardiopsis rhodophaea]